MESLRPRHFHHAVQQCGNGHLRDWVANAVQFSPWIRGISLKWPDEKNNAWEQGRRLSGHATSEVWRPQGDSNPRYRRERAVS